MLTGQSNRSMTPPKLAPENRTSSVKKKAGMQAASHEAPRHMAAPRPPWCFALEDGTEVWIRDQSGMLFSIPLSIVAPCLNYTKEGMFSLHS